MSHRDPLFFFHVTGSRSVVPIQSSCQLEQFLECSRKSSQLAEDFMQIHISAHKLRYSNRDGGMIHQRCFSYAKSYQYFEYYRSLRQLVLQNNMILIKNGICITLNPCPAISRSTGGRPGGCFGKQFPKHDLHNPLLKQNPFKALHNCFEQMEKPDDYVLEAKQWNIMIIVLFVF